MAALTPASIGMKTLPAPFLSLTVGVVTKKVDRNLLMASLWLALAIADFVMAAVRAKVHHTDYSVQIVLGAIYSMFGIVYFAVFRRNRTAGNASRPLAQLRQIRTSGKSTAAPLNSER